MVAEAEAALTPCGMNAAIDHIEAMLAVFAAAGRDGSRQAADERALYVTAMTAALAACPAHCVAAAVADVVQRHRYGLPLPGDVTARAEAFAEPIRHALAVARAHLREHARRDERRRRQAAEDARGAWSKSPEGRAVISATVARMTARLARRDGGCR